MLRGFAAVYVFAGHFLIERVLPKQSHAALFLRFGQEAVMLFFLLSGFVVYYSTAKHGDAGFRTYFVRRARRIYPIFLLSLVVAYGCAWLRAPVQGLTVPAGQLLGNLCMLQDFGGGKPGVWVAPLYGNFPLWSLSYEWWFYMLFFPMYRFVAPGVQIHVAAVLSVVGFATYTLHPNQVSLFLLYFILWWCGAELGRSYLARVPLTFASQKRPLLYLLLLNALLAGPVLFALLRHQPLSYGIHPILELRHFGACLFFLVGGLLWRRARWVGFRAIFGVFAFVAPISYALYVFHYPLAVTSSYLAAVPSTGLRLFGYVAVSVAAAYLAEVPFQNWVNRVTKRLAQSPRRPTPPDGVAMPP